MNRARHQTGGFTVIEVMIAMLIMATCMFSTISLLQWAIRGTDQSARTTAALAAAQDKLEELVGRGYTQITPGSDSANGFTRAWTVNDIAGAKEVQVTAYWYTIDQAARSLSVRTTVAR